MELGKEHRLLVAGEWVETASRIEVRSPYDGTLVGTVPEADASLVDRAVTAARDRFREGGFSQADRAAVLDRAAALLLERSERFADTLARESGKPIKQARVEAQRASSTLSFSAVEARKLAGELVPMEASAAGSGKIGFVMRVPMGVVGAISPFNFPLNLVCHKVGPAIAAGNTVVLKPASQTPLSAIALAELLLEAGLPASWLSVVCGGGAEVGVPIVAHPDVSMITFTGSAPVGWEIRAKAPTKRVSLELGSTAPLIVDADSDWQSAADKASIHAFSHAGQSCISIQRMLLHDDVADAFLERFVEKVEALRVGDPLDESTDVGPLIDESNRDRVLTWIDEARHLGGEVLAGGGALQDGTIAPTVIYKPAPTARVACQEIFGPVVTVDTFADFQEAVDLANASDFGLQAGVYTRDVGKALTAARSLNFGGVLINEVPTFRADQMPYGGVKNSGNTREGPAYAVHEQTEMRFVSLQG